MKAPGRLPRGAIQEGAERHGRCAARRSGRGLGGPKLGAVAARPNFGFGPRASAKGASSRRLPVRLYDDSAPLCKRETNSRRLCHLPATMTLPGVRRRVPRQQPQWLALAAGTAIRNDSRWRASPAPMAWLRAGSRSVHRPLETAGGLPESRALNCRLADARQPEVRTARRSPQPHSRKRATRVTVPLKSPRITPEAPHPSATAARSFTSPVTAFGAAFPATT